MRTVTPPNIACAFVLVAFVAMFLIMSWTTRDRENSPLASFPKITARKATETVTTFETIPQQNSDKRDQGAAARNLEAKQRLKQFCNNFKSAGDRMWHMNVNSKLHLAYCFIPKVASRTLRSYFKAKISAKGSESLRSYTQFMFVREPFGRLLSCYKDKFLNKQRLSPGWMKLQLDILPNGTSKESYVSGEALVSFKKFIEWVIKDVNVKMDIRSRHWKPFHEICMPCSYDYDFIGHYEFLSDDINYVRKLARAETLEPFPISQESKTSSELISYYSQIPPKWIVRLGEIYRADFEMFGYSFPGPVKELVKDIL